MGRRRGRGYRHSEFTGFCIPSEEAEERFEEGLEVVLKAWTTEGRFSHHGKFWNFEKYRRRARRRAEAAASDLDGRGQ